MLFPQRCRTIGAMSLERVRPIRADTTHGGASLNSGRMKVRLSPHSRELAERLNTTTCRPAFGNRNEAGQPAEPVCQGSS